MCGTIYADLRCLQDPGYQYRGIGYHASALLRTRRKSELSTWKTIGLIDPQLPALPSEYAALVDETSCSVNPCLNWAPAIFLDGSPMTHDPRFTLRFQNKRGLLGAAVVHDFIPFDWPGYLPKVADRIAYVGKLARLRKINQFFPTSEYTAWRLSELLGVSRDRMHVIGAAVRSSLYELRDQSSTRPPYEGRPYFLTVGGGDIRKNAAVAVKAVRNLNLLYSRPISLKVVGHYDNAQKADLLQLACHTEGAGFLEFCSGVSDPELVSRYAGAIATIAPSHIEGFSLPVVEASVCGCPVVASTCAAQMELVEQAEALFPSDDAVVLAQRLDALLNQPALRASLVAAQAHLGPKFHEDAVGERFWKPLAAAVRKPRSVGALAGKKPSLAFLSPFPPDQSGPALFTAMTMGGGEGLFESNLYTDAPRPLLYEGRFRDAGRVNLTAVLDGRHDAVISVLGNSSYHTSTFEFFERFGGPCILHDSRLTQIYFHRLGQERFLQLASRLLGRGVTMEEAVPWLQDKNPQSLFLEPIIERASPLIVHTVTQQTLLKRKYGVDAHVTTCCPTMSFGDDELTSDAKSAARQRRGIPPGAFAVSTFGFVSRAKGMVACILALEMLRSWRIPAELYFIGSSEFEKGEVARIANSQGIAEHVHYTNDFVNEATYRDFLIASDAGVQLRTYGLGQFSAALSDCVSAGLPTVASADLAASCGAPEYVLTVPDRFSPLQVAEQLALIWESCSGDSPHSDARAVYLETHNFNYYGKRLLEILGLA